MARPDYTEIDHLIECEIGRGNRSHKDLLFTLKAKLEEYCYDDLGRYKGSATQILSTRLQAMKRWGRIMQTGVNGWAPIGKGDTDVQGV